MRPADDLCRFCKAPLPPRTGKLGRPHEVCSLECRVKHTYAARNAKRRAETAKRRAKEARL